MTFVYGVTGELVCIQRVSIQHLQKGMGSVPKRPLERSQRASGARLHAAYVRLGAMAFDMPNGLMDDIFKWATQFNDRLDEFGGS